MDRALQLLKDLIAVDSVNPSLVPGAAGEARGRAHDRGSDARHRPDTSRPRTPPPAVPTSSARSRARAPGRSLMFCGHIDTVGVAGMTAPFDPAERDGRIYGRGSQDMKSGVAAMIDAARVIAESGGLAAGKLVIACVVDEEHASIGADALVTRWRADAAVVTEPTDLQVAIAHKGFEWVEIETEGRAAHGSRPREGRDAIRLMGRVLNGLDALDRDLQAGPPHALLGTASLHASLIEGGRELSSYPDRCHLQMERRTIPGEAPGRRGEGSRRAADALARGGSRLQGREQGNVRALAVRDRREPRTAAGDARARPHCRHLPRTAPDRHELLDRRGDPRRRRHPVDPVRTDRRRAAQRRRVGRRAVGADVPRRARRAGTRLVPLDLARPHRWRDTTHPCR